MRTFFITDIHGHFKPFEKLLQSVRFNPNEDRLIIGGDMIDRGPDSGEVLKKIKYLQDNYPDNVVALKGNHEEMMEEHLNEINRRWLSHGGFESLQSFNRVFPNDEEFYRHLGWVKNLPIILETDEFIFTHAGISPSHSIKKQPSEIIWTTQEEFYGFNKQDILKCTGNKPIVHGHTATESIYFDGARMNCDLGMGVFLDYDAGLALVDITNFEAYVYSPYENIVSKHPILTF
jgi:serine/threonine protein phosphatase 1